MDEAERQMHFLVGMTYGRAAACGNKIDYKSEASADKAARALERKDPGRDREGYPCVWCNGWHVGRAMTEEERRRFSDALTDPTEALPSDD